MSRRSIISALGIAAFLGLAFASHGASARLAFPIGLTPHGQPIGAPGLGPKIQPMRVAPNSGPGRGTIFNPTLGPKVRK